MRPFTLSVLAGCLLLTLAAAKLPAADSVPLRELAELLDRDIDPENRAELSRYQKSLEERIDALTRLADLRDALGLAGWQRGGIPAQPDEDTPLTKVYQAGWNRLAERLAKALHTRLAAESEKGQRLAALIFLAEMAGAERHVDRGELPNRGRPGVPLEWGRPARRFTPRLTGEVRNLLAQDKDLEVRARAARAVVEIAPTEAATLDALRPLLHAERKPIERRAAAEGLERMIHDLEYSLHSGGAGVARSLAVAAQVVKAAGSALRDEDAAIRRRCLETIRQAAQYIGRIEQEVPLQRPQPQESVPADRIYQPLIEAIDEQTEGVAGLLGDGSLAVRLSAHRLVEDMAALRRYLRSRDSTRPRSNAARLDGVLKTLPALKTSLADKEVRVRLAALYVLETLGGEAAPAAAEIAQALKDDNGFVRWGAARALHNLAPQAPEKAVPALAAVLKDHNKTVRLTAVYALSRYGAKASEAVKPLAEAVADAEPPVRVGAIRALAAIGEKAGPQSVVLVRVLKEDKTPGARAAAAQALGRLAAGDPEWRQALRAALDDPDAAVREAASAALLDHP